MVLRTPGNPKPRVRSKHGLGNKELELLKCMRCGEVCAKEGYVGEEDGVAQTCGCGVWVSWDLWQRIHNQLIGRKEEIEIKTEEQITSSNRFESEVSVLHQRIKDMEDDFKTRELELKSALMEKLRETVSSKREVDESRTVRERELRESHARMQDLNLQVEHQAKERDDLTADRLRLQKELDEAHLRVRVTEHKTQVAESRSCSMEKEMVLLKDRNAGNMLRIEALEKRVKDTESAANDWRVHADMYKAKLSQHVGPSRELATEADRVKLDNRRLVGMLEQTDEFRTLMTTCALTRGTHYVTLAECLVEEGWVSQIYAPEMDRPLDVNLEEYHWLPKKAIAITASFLEEVFPRLPTGPFMHLLMHLSKVWKEHHKDDTAERKKRHDAEVAELRRALGNQRPYYAVYANDKIKHLKKAVKSHSNNTKEERRLRGKDKAEYGQDSRVMLKWGLNTMEHLSKQVSEMMDENKALRSSLGSPLTKSHNGPFPKRHSTHEYALDSDEPAYRAMVSPRSPVRTPSNTFFGSDSYPLRAPQTALDGVWASTPIGATPFTPPTDGMPTEPAQPYFVTEEKAAMDKQEAARAARRSSLAGGAGNSPPQDNVTVFKRTDGANV